MNRGTFWWLGGVIAAHKGRQVVGRTRLQMTVKLLQRLGLPSDYLFTIFFHGPYSRGGHSDIRVLEMLGLVKDIRRENGEAGFDVCRLGVSRDPSALLSGLRRAHADVVFNLFEGVPDQCGTEEIRSAKVGFA